MPPKRKAPEPAAAAPPEAQLFAGCRIVFWAGPATSVLQKRIQQLGGHLQSEIVAAGTGTGGCSSSEATTHVVCPAVPVMTAKHAASKLHGFKGSTVEVRVADGTVLHLPQGVAFVLPDWASKSIARQALQPTEPFLPLCLRPAPATTAPPAAAGAPPLSPLEAAAAAAEAAGAAAVAGAQAGLGSAQEEQQPTSSAVTVPLSEQEQWAAEQDVMQPAAAGTQELAQQVQQQQQQGEGGQPPPHGRVHCRVVRRGAEFVAVQGTKPAFTGGLTGIPWGSYGVWDEPYDTSAARETVSKLRSFWFRTQDSQQQQRCEEPAASRQCGRQLNGVCEHVCCSRRPYCLVSKMGQYRALYQEGKGVDQFKLKQIDRAVQQLAAWSEPLDSAEDVERVGLGKKSAAKVVELLETGESSRVQAAVGDEHLQAVNRFQEVWGVGSATASRWYAAGCRTLDDVRARAEDLNLTEQQRVGLKFFDDLAKKIPRQEVARAEVVVRDACFDLAERWGADDVERCFCFATGSYKRGQPESSDIDILTCLPPSLAGADCPTFLSELLSSLLARGLLLDEMSARDPAPAQVAASGGACASWMGLCLVDRPGGLVRRIDVKVYPNAATPFAVNYFANSQYFCRATRHWANYAVPERAHKYNSAATGFKLSDMDLQPIAKQWQPARHAGGRDSRQQHHGAASSSDSETEHQPAGAGAGRKRDSRWTNHRRSQRDAAVLGPEVPCADESAIFRELGLAFVPVRMRTFAGPT